MKNIWNTIILLMIVYSFALACKTTDKIESLSAGCVTSDGKKIGVGIKGKAFVLDAKDGKTIKDLEVIGKQGAIVCSRQNEVFVVYSDQIINIESGKKYPRRIADSTIIGINSKGNLVGHQKTNIGKKRGEELELFIEKSTDQSDDLKSYKLPLETLGAVQRNKKTFLTMPVKLLKDNILLVFAGGKAREIPANETDEFGPDIWGFYKVKLENGGISPTKIIDKADESASLFNAPFTDATADGKFVAVAFSHTEGKIALVFNTETGEEIFRHKFFKNEATGRSFVQIARFNSITLSEDGSKLAVAGEWGSMQGRVYSKETHVTIYDLKSGDEISKYEFEEGIIDILKFENDELIIDFEKGTVAKINAVDGKNIWKKLLDNQR